MGKCLVTKLQGNVSGDLPYLGALKITVKKTDGITNNNQRRLVIKTKDDNCRIFTADGSKKLSTKEDLSNPSSSFVYKTMYKPTGDGRCEIYFLDGDYTVYITSKYNFTDLGKWGNASNYSFDIEELKYSTLLSSITLSNLDITGDISSLSGMTALTSLTLSNLDITGDISSLSGMTALTSLTIIDDLKVTGTFESHISAVSSKRTSGSCIYWLSGSNITYNGKLWVTGKKLVEFNSDGCDVYDYSTNSKGSKIASYVKSTNSWSYNN